MNHILSIVFIALLTVAGAAQEITKNDRTPTRLFGSVSGEIVIKEKSGNGLGNFACSNLVVSLNKLGGGWEQKVRAYGDFSKLRCRFVVPAVSAGQSFVAVLNAKMPSCDQKTFDATTSFPMKLKGSEILTYNFSVTKISCSIVK
jgi:hypothetical protein